MNGIDLDALQALAEKATRGEWWDDSKDPCELIRVYRGTGFDRRLICDGAFKRDAAYIAAANPQTILSLIARIRELEGKLPCSPEQAIAAWKRRADTGKSAEE